MAYEVKITAAVDGAEHLYEVLETEAAAGSETSEATDEENRFMAVPEKFRIIDIEAELESGDGGEIFTALGFEVGWTDSKFGQIARGPGGVAATRIHDQTTIRVSAPTKRMYLRSNVDIGVNNKIRTKIKVLAGWGP